MVMAPPNEAALEPAIAARDPAAVVDDPTAILIAPPDVVALPEEILTAPEFPALLVPETNETDPLIPEVPALDWLPISPRPEYGLGLLRIT